MPHLGSDARRILGALLASFHRTHRVRVKVWTFPWSTAWDRLMAALKRRQWDLAPDVLQIDSSWTCTLAYLGALRELTSRLWEVGRDAFVPGLLESCYLPDTRRLYAVPWLMDLRVLYFRRDALARAGASPDDLSDWESFRRVCRRVTRGSGRDKDFHTLVLSGVRGEGFLHDLAPWIWSAGGELLTPDGRGSAFHRDRALRGMEFFLSLMADGSVPVPGRDLFSPGHFFTGHAAFQFSGAWPLSTVFRPGHPRHNPEVARHFGVAPFPRGPAGRFTFLGGSHLALAATSRRPEESWALIRHLVSPETQAAYARAVGALPPRPAALPGFFPRRPEEARVFLDSLSHARVLPQVPLLGSFERFFVRYASDLARVLADGRPDSAALRDGLARAAREADRVLSQHYG